MLKDASDLGEALLYAVRLVMPDPNMRMYFEELLRQKHSHLSPTTARRHKLTVHGETDFLFMHQILENQNPNTVVERCSKEGRVFHIGFYLGFDCFWF